MRIFRMIIECLSPLHCGSGAPSWIQDQPVVRDAFGYWTIPGTSLAGSLRSLAEKLDASLASKLFGGEKASLFWSADARLLDYDDQPALEKQLAGKDVALPVGPFLRDHVRLDSESETAQKGGKFDEEIVPPGTRFAIEFAFDAWDRKDVEKELGLFDRLCALAAAGAMPLGAHGTNGMGSYRVLKAESREFDLHSFAGMQDWLRLSSGIDFVRDGGKPVILPAAPVLPQHEGISGTLTIPFEADGPLIVGGGSALKSGDDIVFATTPTLDYEKKSVTERFVIPGSSVKGAFRHAMYRICLARGFEKRNAEQVMNALFGHAEGDSAQRGKLSFSEAALGDALPLSVPHVAIDRFSGGALDGALFSEGPVWKQGMPVSISVSFEGLSPAEAALLFHALFDMAEGALSLGGGAGRGCGRLSLRGWDTDPIKALSAWKGSLYWNGSSIHVSDAESMTAVFKRLDEESNKAVTA
ncbi:MAG: hypothetical protein IKJ34_07435 [Mailhella sp.]|nr:hypothetical protein [Mailhella sp.]